MTKKLPDFITAEWLCEQGACEYQVDKFAALFPNGACVDADNMARALSGWLAIDWLAYTFLNDKQSEQFGNVADGFRARQTRRDSESRDDLAETSDKLFTMLRHPRRAAAMKAWEARRKNGKGKKHRA